MSTLLEQASLVMIPSGYKEDIVYSQIPTNGNGDLTFTRASNGTRVNSAGLVEVTPWNLLQQSSEFNVAPWAFTGGVTITSGFTDVNGGTNACRFQATSGSYKYGYQTVSSTIGQIYTHSIYAKCSSGTQQFKLTDAQQGGGSLQTVTTEWQRFTFTLTASGGNIAIELGSDGTNALDIYICFAQTNIGSTAKPYFPTTDRLNVPRLTYQNGGGGCPSLLLEKQSTNLVLQSEAFNSVSWSVFTTGSGTVNVVANAAISPDGTQNADEIQLTRSALTEQALLYQQQYASNATYSRTIYLKAARSQDVGKKIDVWSYNGSAVLDPISATLTADWQRFDAGTSTGALVEILSFGYLTSSIHPTTSGTDVRFYAWGAQGEASSYATSYIPTTSSSATRVADVYSRSLSNIASGTAYVNITDNVALETPGTHVYGPFAITSASLGLYLSRPNNQRLRLWTAGSNNVFQTTVTNLKLAITWDGTNVNVYQNGVKVVTSYAYALTNVNNLFSSTNIESSATIAEIALFNSVLTDAECISLTS